MVSVKETDLYTEVIKEFNYPFGNIFVFKGFVISGMIEKLFYTKKIKYFNDVFEAVNFAKKSIIEIA